MTLDEKIQWLVIGAFIGFVLGYVVRLLQEILAKVDHTEKVISNESKWEKNDAGFMRIPLVADLAYLFALCLILFGLWQTSLQSQKLEENAEQSKISRCEAGVENRNVQRQTVDAVFSLAASLTERTKNDPPLTEAEVLRINAYIDRLNTFRTDMYDKIKPSEECAPYVEDDDVDPPGLPLPYVVQKE